MEWSFNSSKYTPNGRSSFSSRYGTTTSSTNTFRLDPAMVPDSLKGVCKYKTPLNYGLVIALIICLILMFSGGLSTFFGIMILLLIVIPLASINKYIPSCVTRS
jgi:hypothetical protein